MGGIFGLHRGLSYSCLLLLPLPKHALDRPLVWFPYHLAHLQRLGMPQYDSRPLKEGRLLPPLAHLAVHLVARLNKKNKD
jgi:hypothetical protein